MNKRSHLKAGAQQALHFPWENREISPLRIHSLQEWRLADQRTEDPALGIQPQAQAQAPCLQDDSQWANWRQNHPPSTKIQPSGNKNHKSEPTRERGKRKGRQNSPDKFLTATNQEHL